MFVTISAYKRSSVRHNLQFVVTCSCIIYVTCVLLGIVVSKAYSVVFLLCFSLSYVQYGANFSGLSFLIGGPGGSKN